MRLESQITFYLSERKSEKVEVISMHGRKKVYNPSGFHYQFISWKKIFKNYNPRKFIRGTEIRKNAILLCKSAIEYAFSKCSDPEEIQELKAAYNKIEYAESKEGQPTEVFN